MRTRARRRRAVVPIRQAFSSREERQCLRSKPKSAVTPLENPAQHEVLRFTGTQSRHTLGEAFHSQARGCLLKSEGAEVLLRALESIRHHHRFGSNGITEVCDDICATNGKLGTLTERERETARLIAEGKSTKQIAS